MRVGHQVKDMKQPCVLVSAVSYLRPSMVSQY